MKSDWVPCDGYGDQVSVPLTGVAFYTHVIPLLGTGLGVEQLDNQVAVMDDTEMAVTSHRVVGQVMLQITGVGEPLGRGTFIVTHRTALGMYSQVTGDWEIFTDVFTGPFAAEDANEPFLHERHYVLQNEEPDVAFVNTLDVQRDPGWSHFDIRVKRRLQANQALLHIIQVVNVGVDDLNVSILPWLRTYATSKG